VSIPDTDPAHLLAETVERITPLDGAAVEAARARQGSLTKPPGSLGVLEEVSVRLAGITGTCPPAVPARPVVAVFAADHGVVASGVTPWPQEVTTAMVENFRAGGAAVNVLAAQAGADVVVVDIGVASDVKEDHVVWARKVRPGTADLAQGPAMTREDALAALVTGVRVAEELVAAGYDVIATGDMGIGNTTASACLIAHLTGRPAAEITGRGTGIDDAMLAHKTEIVASAVSRLESSASPSPDPVEVLAEVGGLEHAGLAGLVLGAAALRVPVVLDGVIAGAAALVAQALAPSAIDCCFAGHRSVEPGHAAALATLGLRPLVDLDLRLGEGSGAVLALPLVRSAAAVLRDMATFESAGIPT
jgi:nicotinate-nucleotide--dimethylbenzimidazole phosphoribosyltransferase